jgi:hypothetical protein
LPPLRLILVWDNLAGHLSSSMVTWLFAHGAMPLYTPLSGSWLNMAESVQCILCGRALNGQHPKTASEIITWLEDTVAGWNAAPTRFVYDCKRRSAGSVQNNADSPAPTAVAHPQPIAA